jgi:hypothetical protein
MFCYEQLILRLNYTPASAFSGSSSSSIPAVAWWQQLVFSQAYLTETSAKVLRHLKDRHVTCLRAQTLPYQQFVLFGLLW